MTSEGKLIEMTSDARDRLAAAFAEKKAQKISTASILRRANVTADTLQAIVHGKTKRPQLDTIEALCMALGESIAWIKDGKRVDDVPAARGRPASGPRHVAVEAQTLDEWINENRVRLRIGDEEIERLQAYPWPGHLAPAHAYEDTLTHLRTLYSHRIG